MVTNVVSAVVEAVDKAIGMQILIISQEAIIITVIAVDAAEEEEVSVHLFSQIVFCVMSSTHFQSATGGWTSQPTRDSY